MLNKNVRAPEVEEFRTNLDEAKTPLLGKGGVAAPSRKMARRHRVWRGRGGSFKLPLESIRRLNKPPRRCELIVIRRYSPPCTTALLCPTSFAGHGGIEDNWRESRSPLLAQGGVAAPIKKMPRSLLSGRRRGGWFKPPIIGS